MHRQIIDIIAIGFINTQSLIPCPANNTNINDLCIISKIPFSYCNSTPLSMLTIVYYPDLVLRVTRDSRPTALR